MDSAVLKQHLPTYLERIGHAPCVQANGIDLKARCPLHDDRNPSLCVTKKDDVWVWFCHPCKEGGTVIELHARRRNLDPKKQFQVICREVAEIINGAPVEARMIDQSIDPPAKMDTPPIPDDEIAELTTPWRKTLYDDTALRDRFATELGLPSNLLKAIANRGLQGVGIAQAGFEWPKPDGEKCTLRQPRLVYIGDGYCKVRSPFGDGRKPRFLTYGKPQRPWLSEWLVHDQTTVNQVHLHESESSALALIAAGYWASDNSSIVVATSGCGGFKTEWVPLFAGRTVEMWPDADEPGKRFAETTANLLYGTARKVLIRDWNPTTNAEP